MVTSGNFSLQEKQKQNKTLDQLQHELNESNLALSEARSSLAATQRQEKQTRNFLESQIRELQQRIFKLEVCMLCDRIPNER